MARFSVRAWLPLAALLTTSLAIESSLAAEAKSVQLPLKKVVLFSSGVAFFQHDGKVDGNAKVEMKFKAGDINDLLKSMVLQDLNGGQISTVTYGSKDPITKTLQTFSIDLTRDTTLADLLRQIRGEKVQVDVPNSITGVILGVETRLSKSAKDEVTSIDILNLLTSTGVRAIPLDSVRETRLLDERLNAELQQALEILAMSHSVDKKSVTLNFQGQGSRAVRLGYIQESPIWKTTYRLVLDEGKLPFLQGWAIVENTSEQDWEEIGLTLVSGRPISFIMDLYEPLYAGRPVVEPELFASLRPQTYNQDLADQEKRFRDLATSAAASAARPAPGRSSGRSGGGGFFGGFGGMGGGGMGFFGGSSPTGTNVKTKPVAEADPMNLDQGVQSAAQADDVGELFRYAITTPVSLPRQKSAMIPIVNDTIEGEKLSIYNPAVDARHPLNGVKFTNSTGLHLMQGPITVFDEGVYAGDAQIQDLPPSGKRLVSYALDLDTEIVPTTKKLPDELVEARVTGSVYRSVHRRVRSHQYLIKNSGKHAKKILVELPIDAAWKLVSAKPSETTRDLYRFAVVAEPGEPVTLVVDEEQTEVNSQPLEAKFRDLTLEIIAHDVSFANHEPADEAFLVALLGPQLNLGPAEEIVSVRLSKGNLHESRQLTRRNAITFRNSGEKPQEVTVEFPVDPFWTLTKRTTPKVKTADFYRYVVTIAPQKVESVVMEEQAIRPLVLGIDSIDDAALLAYANSKVASAAVKAAVTEVLKRRAALAKVAADQRQAQQALEIVDQEQSRIRQNMQTLEHASELYKRYVKKFGEQEDQVESLRTQQVKLTGEESAQRQKLREYLESLDVK